jgi:hypothetical protein
MKIIIQVSTQFDGTTLPSAGAQLIHVGPDTYAFVDASNAPLATLGRLPMRSLAAMLGARAGRLAYARHDGGAGVTSFSVAVGTETAGVFELVSPIRAQDPNAGDAHVSDLVVLGHEYDLVLTSNAIGLQRVVLELVPGSPLELLARSPAADPFGPTLTPGNAGTLAFSRLIATAAVAVGLGTILRYDASAGTFAVAAPGPALDGRFAVKEAVNDPAGITVDGTVAGVDLESPTGGFGSLVTVVGANAFVEWQYDLNSNLYRIVS